jgi:hypothetical protein
MAHEPERDWMVVAPWWKWGDPPDPTDTLKGRLSRPVFQKYESANLVNDFIKDPQRCLAFVDDDFVQTVQRFAPALGTNGKPLKLLSYALDDKGKPKTDGAGNPVFDDFSSVRDPSNTRKIFLDTHRRFYLVVCQMHCDAPGFPRATRGNICEAGFVVRRRTTNIPPGQLRVVNGMLSGITAAQKKLAQIEEVEQEAGANQALATGTVGRVLAEAGVARVKRLRASTLARLDVERQNLGAWATRFGVAPQLQGWLKTDGLEKIGAWAAVEETPDDLGREAVFPLIPLIPDRNDKKHAGQYGTIYFGLLPTGTGETDDRGQARFDDQNYYEVRCFVKRHKKPHDRGSPCKCPDGIFWSLPTETYRIASHFDPVGTSNRPVTIQMPDINALAAQAKPSLGVSFAKPPGSLMISGNKDGTHNDGSRSGSFEICSFAIPLFSIVAMFLFELFLPVVMLIFGLFFMLRLKFCIPPELNVAADLAGHLDLKAFPLLKADLIAKAGMVIDDEFAGQSEMQDALKGEFEVDAIADMEFNAGVAADAVRGGTAAGPGGGPSVTAGLVWQKEIVHP